MDATIKVGVISLGEGSKAPRTERGRRTLRALLDAAAAEFGEKGFHDGSVSGITRRAGCALGSFYTYFDSKDEVFRALVRDNEVHKDTYIDAVIERAKAMLGEDGFRQAFKLALDDILADIRQDLEEFGVRYDEWFSERSLATNGAIDRALALRGADRNHKGMARNGQCGEQ